MNEIKAKKLYDVVTSESYFNNFDKTSVEVLYKDSIRILSLNLHCYQESNQDKVFKKIANGIRYLNPHIIAFQEVAQLGTNPDNADVKQDNSAYVIKRLIDKLTSDTKYYLLWTPAHIGFDIYEEGMAVLTSYGIIDRQRYVFHTQKSFIRTGLYACLKSPFGHINIFNTHLHYETRDTAIRKSQLKESINYLDEKKNQHKAVSNILCGDFNNTVNYPSRETSPIRLVLDNGYMNTLNLDNTIDYVFIKSRKKINIIESKLVFNNNMLGRVSDHQGVFIEFSLS